MAVKTPAEDVAYRIGLGLGIVIKLLVPPTLSTIVYMCFDDRLADHFGRVIPDHWLPPFLLFAALTIALTFLRK